MRDLIDLITYLSEGQGLSAGELKKHRKTFNMPVIGKVEKMQRLVDAGGGKARAATTADTEMIGFANQDKDTTTHDEIQIIQYPRFEALITAILKKEPLELSDGSTVVIDPNEADRLEGLVQTEDFGGTIKLKLDNGEQILLSNLAKTSRFGGEALGGSGGEEVGKESALLKPSQIGIEDKEYSASQLYEEIINNQTLLKTDYGKSVIEMAKKIMQGENPEIPQEHPAKVKKAITDYASEYLGVLALIKGLTTFEKKQEFETWLGGNISDLLISFPKETNYFLADSIAEIRNKKTNHSINISSKRDAGAPPSLGKLKIPEEVANDPKLKGAVEFIELCQENSPLPKPLSISSAFGGMNILYEANPGIISNKFNKFLPWNVEEITNIAKQSMQNFSLDPRAGSLPKKYQSLWEDTNFSDGASDGGKLVYTVKKEVMEIINEKQGLPGFRESVLIILDMNFIQQYTKPKKNILTFETFWPAKLDGKVTLKSKAAATDPTKGGFSFMVSPEKPTTRLEKPNEKSSRVKAPDQEYSEKTAAKIAKGTQSKTTTKKTGNAGRNKRQ